MKKIEVAKDFKKEEVSVLENEVTLMGKTFNVYGTVEEPLFRAKDVADWIEHSDSQKMIQSVDDDEKILRTMFGAGQSQELCCTLGTRGTYAYGHR